VSIASTEILSDRSQFIAELALYYQTNNYELSKSKHYKAVCLTVLTKYEHFKKLLTKICDDENKARLKSEIYRKKYLCNNG
jgi:hypothetical protein